VILSARRLRSFGRAGSGRSRPGRLVIAAAVACLLGLEGGGQAFAQGPRPEPAPGGARGSAPQPEAPPVSQAVAEPSTRSSSTPQGAQATAPSVDREQARFAPPAPSNAPAQSQASSAPVRRPPASATLPKRSLRRVAQAILVRPIGRASTRHAVGGAQALPPTGSHHTNLLLLGGLAMLLLVLGEAMFLTLSARSLREARE
jgi:hypothetical protein